MFLGDLEAALKEGGLVVFFSSFCVSGYPVKIEFLFRRYGRQDYSGCHGVFLEDA